MKTTLAARTVLLLFLLLGHQLRGQVRAQARNPAGVFIVCEGDELIGSGKETGEVSP